MLEVVGFLVLLGALSIMCYYFPGKLGFNVEGNFFPFLLALGITCFLVFFLARFFFVVFWAVIGVCIFLAIFYKIKD